MSDASALILGSVVVIVGTTIIRKVRENTGDNRYVEPVISGFLLAVALLAIALVAPGFAKGLALLGLVGAFAVNGPALFDIVGKL